MGNNLIKWDGVEKFPRCSEGNQMLGRWVLSIALILASGSVQASGWAESMFNELNKDFGSVPRGPTLVHHFRVKNNTSETVHISGVRVSCGCVSASVLKSQIEPNEETSVIANMDSTRFNGSKSVTVYVSFDKPMYEEVRLLVQAYGRNDFAVSPDNFNFNEIRRGKSAESKITLRFYGFPNLEVVEAKTESHYLKVKYELIKREGGYVNNPNDRGGATNFGITEVVARASGFKGNMKDLPLATAKDIYKKQYWISPRFDQVNVISNAVAEELLDTGVNCGTGFAKPLLQRALNLLNNQGQGGWPDLAIDGVYGAATLNALKIYLGKRGKEGEKVLVRTLNIMQGQRYIEICERNPSQEQFFYGWINNRVS